MIQDAFKKSVLVVDAVLLMASCLVAWSIWSTDGLVAALVGNALGLANIMIMAWLMGRLASRGDGGRAVYGGLIALKLGGMLGLVALLLWVFQLHAPGFLVGFSALMLALVVASLWSNLGSPAHNPGEQEIG